MSNYQFINIIILILILYFLFNSNFFLKNGLVFQNQSSKFSFLFSSAVLIYIILLLFLYQTWYGANPTVNFHFFNDWPEWNYMDKFGHFFTAFHISDVSIRVINWIGFSKKKSLIGGLVLGLVFPDTYRNYGWLWLSLWFFLGRYAGKYNGEPLRLLSIF